MAEIRNQATLSYNGSVVNSNIVVGRIAETLTATKSAIPETYRQGDTITYVVNIVNSGTAPVTGVTVTDDLGTYTAPQGELTPLSYVDGSAAYFANGVPTPGTVTVEAGPPLVISGITVPAGGNVAIVYLAKVNEFAPLGEDASVTNTLTVDGTGVTPFTADAVINAETSPVLSITKSMEPSSVIENGEVTYSFLIENYGSEAATSDGNAVIRDTLDPILSGLTAAMNSAPMTPVTDYSYSEDTGVFETTPGVVTVPAATYSQDETTGAWTTTPGSTTVEISGSII